jgi:hypothetical protein
VFDKLFSPFSDKEGNFMLRDNKGLVTPLVVILFLLLPGCSTNGGGGGGITIAQIDGTGPTVTLGAGQPGGQDVAVSTGGSDQNTKLRSKTGSLNLLAMSKDPESGVQALEIWVEKKTTSCDANGHCSTRAPIQLEKPRFESTSPQKHPGESTADTRILAQALDLSMEIPQGSVSGGDSLTVVFVIYAKAVNHLGGRVQTPKLTATWSEP